MLNIFLTSSPTGPLDGSRSVDGIDKWNGFCERLHKIWPQNARCLMIASDPWNFSMMDEMTGFFWHTWLREGFSMECMDKLDHRFGSWKHTGAHISREELHSYDVLFLAGGHVPTQNTFFQEIKLREKLKGFQGIIIGISAGSMNSSYTVYIQPEEPGEALDNSFCRWGQGLGLTNIMLCPHYQMVQDKILDGLHLYNDITIPDMKGKELVLLNDGSYLHIEKESADSREENVMLYGESYVIRNDYIMKLCEHEHNVRL